MTYDQQVLEGVLADDALDETTRYKVAAEYCEDAGRDDLARKHLKQAVLFPLLLEAVMVPVAGGEARVIEEMGERLLVTCHSRNRRTIIDLIQYNLDRQARLRPSAREVIVAGPRYDEEELHRALRDVIHFTTVREVSNGGAE